MIFVTIYLKLAWSLRKRTTLLALIQYYGRNIDVKNALIKAIRHNTKKQVICEQIDRYIVNVAKLNLKYMLKKRNRKDMKWCAKDETIWSCFLLF